MLTPEKYVMKSLRYLERYVERWTCMGVDLTEIKWPDLERLGPVMRTNIVDPATHKIYMQYSANFLSEDTPEDVVERLRKEYG